MDIKGNDPYSQVSRRRLAAECDSIAVGRDRALLCSRNEKFCTTAHAANLPDGFFARPVGCECNGVPFREP